MPMNGQRALNFVIVGAAFVFIGAIVLGMV
jgi:hypothetical protein